MTKNLPKVTFGIVNCNRLHYLKSCVESLIFCTDDYPNKEIIIIDNASLEEGTKEYLQEKEKQGIKIIRQSRRDPANEFAKALNMLYRESTGEFIALLQGDSQFILKNKWLEKYIKLFLANSDNIGCIMFDAQRRVTNESHQYSNVLKIDDFYFVADGNRSPASGAGDVLYRRSVLELLYPWEEFNYSHEGGQDSETKMLKKINSIVKDRKLAWFTIMPIFPVSVGIYTDKRGTNARIRGNNRYGDYWPPKKDFRYYHVINYEKIAKKIENLIIPVSIEDVAVGVDFEVFKDASGNWLKNPIDPNNANPEDFVCLGYDYLEDIGERIKISPEEEVIEEEEYLSEWLDEEN